MIADETIRISKPINMLCGSACAHYFLNVFKNKKIEVPNNLFWVTDIAFYLKKLGFDLKVSCYQSNLYYDFQTNKSPTNHPGPLSINQYIKTGSTIFQKKINTKILQDITASKFFLIASVCSKTFNNDLSFSGGHFIIITDFNKKCEIINPRKEFFEIQTLEKKHLLKSLNNFGSWLIQIKDQSN